VGLGNWLNGSTTNLDQALSVTARRAKRDNGGLGEDPPESPMTHHQVRRIVSVRTVDLSMVGLKVKFERMVELRMVIRRRRLRSASGSAFEAHPCIYKLKLKLPIYQAAHDYLVAAAHHS
jgi:hypothetical protein